MNHLTDGNTHQVCGLQVRTLHESDAYTAATILREQGHDEMEAWLFQEPRVFGDVSQLTDDEKCDVLRAMTAQSPDPDRLVAGVRLLINEPELANRSCDTCRKYWFAHDSGTVPADPDGKPMLREPYAPPSCETEVGCLKGHWKEQIALTGTEKQVHDHFLEWRHVGCPLPMCPVMRANWKILETIYRAEEVQAACRRVLRQSIPR